MIKQSEIIVLNRYKTDYDVNISWQPNNDSIRWYITIVKIDGTSVHLATKNSELRLFKNLDTALNFIQRHCFNASNVYLDVSGFLLAKQGIKPQKNFIKIN